MRTARYPRTLLVLLPSIERSLSPKLSARHFCRWRVLTEARSLVVAEFERRYVETMLRASGGNVVRAAAMSGVARRYFQILKSRLGL